MKDWLSIGQFGKQVGLSDRALRLYEQLGLIVPAHRGENGYRYYRQDQLALAHQVQDLKSMGFQLKEILSLLKSDQLINSESFQKRLRERLKMIDGEEKRLSDQRSVIQSILSSLTTKSPRLNDRERNYLMQLFETAVIIVTGLDDLEATAHFLRDQLLLADQTAAIVTLDKAHMSSSPLIVVIPEAELPMAKLEHLKPDVIVVKNMSPPEEGRLPSYLRLYDHVGPEMITVLNADDRASIELAKSPHVQKGKIYYFSKNVGLKNQIAKIGGTISSGDEITIYGFNQNKSEDLHIRIQKVRRHGEEVALIAALTAAMDLGLKKDWIARVV